MVCRAYLTGIYPYIAVWHILGVLPGGRGTTPYCKLSSNSLTPSIRNRLATITPPATSTMSSIKILPPIKIVLDLFFNIFVAHSLSPSYSLTILLLTISCQVFSLFIFITLGNNQSTTRTSSFVSK